MGIKIGKEYRFEAAHHLPNHRGKCAQPHGHSYKLEVEVEGGLIIELEASDDHMIEDFASLDLLVEEIVDTLDHTNLNESALAIGCRRPTAEGLVLAIAETLSRTMKGVPRPYVMRHRDGEEPKLSRVRLYETEKCYAEWTP